MKRRILVAFGMWLWAGLSAADVTLKPFVAGSLDEITSHNEGRAFVLMLWSKDCPPCLRELASIEALDDSLARNLVLISTDDSMHQETVLSLLRNHELQDLDNWIFSDAVIERSRYRVDPEWYGELPRTYFYDSAHRRIAHSGMVDLAQLEKWLAANQPLTTSKTEPH